MDETNRTAYAFPIGTADQVFEPGMTMRDYFAAKAMQSYLCGNDRDSFTYAEWARASYQVADAMLAAREAA